MKIGKKKFLKILAIKEIKYIIKKRNKLYEKDLIRSIQYRYNINNNKAKCYLEEAKKSITKLSENQCS